jgi:hypothetical protein
MRKAFWVILVSLVLAALVLVAARATLPTTRLRYQIPKQRP